MQCDLHSSSISKAGVVLAWTMIVSASLLAPKAGGAQDRDVLDHYRCYTLVAGPSPSPAPVVFPSVMLEDQFDERRQIVEDVWVLPPTRICAPADKRIENPRTGVPDITQAVDRFTHLTMYPLRDKAIHRPLTWNVVVRNQFGTQKLLAKRSRFLAVPTWKDPFGGQLEELPTRPDHFKCYEAVGREVSLKIVLQDQIELANVVVLDPKLFCNPTRKTRTTGEEVEIDDPEAHLTCYDLIEVPTGPFSFVSTEPHVIMNQFAPAPPSPINVVSDEDLLCVPSRKISYSVTGGPHLAGEP